MNSKKKESGLCVFDRRESASCNGSVQQADAL